MRKLLLLIASGLFVSACSFTRDTPAPVVNVTAPVVSVVYPPAVAKATKATVPMVSSSIAAPSTTTINKIDKDEDGKVVQATTANAKSTNSATKAQPTTVTSNYTGGLGVEIGGVNWLRPTDGSIIHGYNQVTTKGVDIEGKEGQPIVAAAAGKVVYSGNGLKGYGNLIIIKHQDNYLTAYSHNKQNLVKEGNLVKQGQKIALLGKNDSDKPVLHFELRKNGKPLNPTPIFK